MADSGEPGPADGTFGRGWRAGDPSGCHADFAGHRHRIPEPRRGCSSEGGRRKPAYEINEGNGEAHVQRNLAFSDTIANFQGISYNGYNPADANAAVGGSSSGSVHKFGLLVT